MYVYFIKSANAIYDILVNFQMVHSRVLLDTCSWFKSSNYCCIRQSTVVFSVVFSVVLQAQISAYIKQIK